MAGYGRGYYGDAQLDTSKPKKGRSWFTVVAVVGVGAGVVWLFWPRSTPPGYSPGGGQGRYPDPPPPSTPPASPMVAVPPPTGALQKQLQEDALARGFATVEAYEDSVVASAKGLQDAGAQVVLAPNLQHLAKRLLPAAPPPPPAPTHSTALAVTHAPANTQRHE
jgi:hypothetical protein